jgi:hypothetical protein
MRAWSCVAVLCTACASGSNVEPIDARVTDGRVIDGAGGDGAEADAA